MSIDTNYDVLRHVLSTYKPHGWAAEFGVYSGYSLGIIAEHMSVVGFDSFEGLPEDWREGFPKGAFAIPESGRTENAVVLPSLPMNAMIVPGWFKDTVPTFPFPPLSLVHVDCDLYSSTVTALEGVIDHISVGTVFVFDEFHGYDGWEEHEAKAWDEFCQRHLITAELIVSGEQERAYLVHNIGG